MSLSDKNPVSESKQHILRKEGIALSHKSSPWKAIKTRPVLFSVCLVTTLLAMAGTAALILLLPFPLIFLAVPLAALAIGSIGLFILCSCLRKDPITRAKSSPSEGNNQTTDTPLLDSSASQASSVSSQTFSTALSEVQTLTNFEPPSVHSPQSLSSNSPSTPTKTIAAVFPESPPQFPSFSSPEISFAENTSHEDIQTTDTPLLASSASQASPVSSITSSTDSSSVPGLTPSEFSSELLSNPPSSLLHATSSESSLHSHLPPSSVGISTQLAGVENPTEEETKGILLEMFGDDFPVDDSELGILNFDDYYATMPAELKRYSLNKHGVTSLSNLYMPDMAGILFSSTDANKSVYRKHGIFDPNPVDHMKENGEDGDDLGWNFFYESNKSSLNTQTILGDISQITKETYISCCPLYCGKYICMPSQEDFCSALAKEFDGKNLIIVDVSSDGIDYPRAWTNAEKYESIVLIDNWRRQHFTNPIPTKGVITNNESMEDDMKTIFEAVVPGNDSETQTGYTLQKFSLNKNEKTNTFYRLRIPKWEDNTALAPEMAQRFLEIYRKVEAKVAERSAHPEQPVYLLAHCNAGMGRAPSFTIYRNIDRVASHFDNLRLPYVYNNARQTQLIVDGKINLSWVMCRILANGVKTRAICGCGKAQYQSYAAYAEYRAKQSKRQNTAS